MSEFNRGDVSVSLFTNAPGVGSFLTVAPGYKKPVSVMNNVFIGPATTDHIVLGDSGASIHDLFAMSSAHPRFDEVRAVLSLSTPRRWWRRALVSVARWMLRRAA